VNAYYLILRNYQVYFVDFQANALEKLFDTHHVWLALTPTSEVIENPAILMGKDGASTYLFMRSLCGSNNPQYFSGQNQDICPLHIKTFNIVFLALLYSVRTSPCSVQCNKNASLPCKDDFGICQSSQKW